MRAKLWVLAAAIAVMAAAAAAQESAVADPPAEGVQDASAAAVEGEAVPDAAEPIADDGSEAQGGAAEVAADAAPESDGTPATEIVEEPLGDTADPAEPQPDAVPDAPEEPVPEGMITAVSCLTCSDTPDGQMSYSMYEDDDYAVSTDDADMVVFEDGGYPGVWGTCDLDDPDNHPCHVDSEFAAEIWFSIAYSWSSDNFTKEPVITVEAGDSAHPELSNFYLNPKPGAEFRVLYHCSPESTGENHLKMTLENKDGTSLDFKWIKMCGGGTNDYFSVTYDGEDDPYNGEDGPQSELDQSVVIGADVAYTTVHMRLLPPARSQNHGQPTIMTDDSVLTTNLRGNGAVAATLYPEGVKFDVLYTCLGEGTVPVNLLIPIPPFDDIHKTWKKTCRSPEEPAPAEEEQQVPLDITPADLGQEEEYEEHAQPSPGVEEDGTYDRAPEIEEAVPVSQDVLMPLEIGTENGLTDVVKEGMASERFNMDFEGSMQMQDAHFRVDEDTREMTFYVRNPAGSTTGQNVHKISLTIRDKRTLLAKVEKRITARFSLTDTGAVIGPNDTASLTIRFICKNAGETSVLVSMQTTQKLVEFGFVKQCREPVKYTERSTLRTAKSLLHVLMAFFVVAACFGLYLYLRSRKGAAPYESVPTGTAQA